MGVGHTDTASQHNNLTGKNSHIFLVLLMEFEPRSVYLESDTLPIELPHHLGIKEFPNLFFDKLAILIEGRLVECVTVGLNSKQ